MTTACPPRPRALPRGLVVGTLVATVLGVEIVLLAPYLGPAVRSVGHARPTWLVVAVFAEVGSMMSFARLQRVMLQTGGVRVRLRDAVATVFAGNAMSVTLPGGSLASLAYAVRRMRSWGASGPLAAFSLAATGVLSTIALTVLAAVGSTAAGDASHLGLVIAEVVAILAAVTAAVVLLGRPAVIRRLAELGVAAWGRLRPSGADRSARLDDVLAELSRLHPSRRIWARGFLFAGVNWVNDLLCLLAACAAVGAAPSVSTVVLAYAAGMAAASSLPVLPGGLGAVEAALVLALSRGDVAVAQASAAVLVYRVISLGLVAVAGWLVLLAQHRTTRVALADR